MLGSVHCVITPFALLSKGTALAPEKHESRKAIETVTAMLNMAREEGEEGGGRSKERNFGRACRYFNL